MKENASEGGPTALLTDLYELTMAYGYWKTGRHAHEATFHLFFREPPFRGGYAVAAGLAPAADWMERFGFAPSDVQYLSGLAGADGRPLFEPDFLRFLAEARFECDVDMAPEGTMIFAHEPLLRVQGPLWQGQLLETALLNILNFQTLIATKASRICEAAGGDPVVEFGARRAQGADGALSASRAAYIGGCAATSNVLAGKVFGIPVKGTHAHSWVMAFEDEPAAFDAYARALPNNCVFLVDTYDTLEGVRNAVRAGKALRERGHDLAGIRLDSGDLAYLSIEARCLLDEAGFEKSVIVASNDLDERLIESLKHQGARIGVWGVGTRLVTAYDQPALGGVYKLGALRAPGAGWRPVLKLSEQAAKVSIPGRLQVRRYGANAAYRGDVIYDMDTDLSGGCAMVDPADATRQRRFPPDTPHRDLLVPVFRKGRRVYEAPPLPEVRRRAQAERATFHPGIRRFLNPHQYPVGLEESLFRRRRTMMAERRGGAAADLP